MASSIRQLKRINKGIKLVMNRKIFTHTLFAVSCCLVISCTNNDNNPHPADPIYLTIPDINFEKILINQGIDSDGEINQQLLKTDAEEVSSLDLNTLSDGPIKDITGIEGFLNLTKLIAVQHDIERINLSTIHFLDTIYLAGNYISSIDISHNPNLILVDIQSNQLTSITGLPNAIKLKKLNLSWNYLEELRIDNESIEVLHLSQNDLRSLNTKGAVNLKNILLTTNKLTTLDLSTNTSLETLLIADNKLLNIDLQYNSNLTHVYLFSNSLTHLDVSHNQELINLKVDRNPDLSCIKIKSGQYIPNVSKSDYQVLSSSCDK